MSKSFYLSRSTPFRHKKRRPSLLLALVCISIFLIVSSYHDNEQENDNDNIVAIDESVINAQPDMLAEENADVKPATEVAVVPLISAASEVASSIKLAPTPALEPKLEVKPEVKSTPEKEKPKLEKKEEEPSDEIKDENPPLA